MVIPHARLSHLSRSSHSVTDMSVDSVSAMDGPRRSLRRREEKSYAESPDLIIEEDSTTSNVAKNNGGPRIFDTNLGIHDDSPSQAHRAVMVFALVLQEPLSHQARR